MNGWIPVNMIWIFIVCFITALVAIWGIIYLSIRAKVNKLNKAMK